MVGAQPIRAHHFRGYLLAAPAPTRVRVQAKRFGLSGYAVLGGTMSDDQIVSAVIAGTSIGGSLLDCIRAAVAGEAIGSDSYGGVSCNRVANTSQCGGGSPPSHASLTILQGGQVGLSLSSSGIAAFAPDLLAGAVGTALGIATFGVGLAITVFGYIFAHHAAAVKAERRLECAGIPAANDSIRAIDSAVQNGTITPDQGVTALNTLWADWQAKIVAPGQAQGVYKQGPGQCDALCSLTYQLQGVIAKLINVYSNMPAPAPPATPAPGSPPAPGATGGPVQMTNIDYTTAPTAASGSPWLMIGLILLGGFLIGRL